MEVKVSFSDREIELVLIALGELPFKTAAPMIQKINAQIAGQKALAKQAVPAEEDKPIRVEEIVNASTGNLQRDKGKGRERQQA